MSDPRVPQILSQRPWRVRDERFALVGLAPADRAAAAQVFAQLDSPFAHMIAEPGIITLLLPEAAWLPLRAAFPQAQAEAPFRVISFDVDLPADLVGFLAAVGGVLAAARVPILAVCGYTKDHVVVRERHLAAAQAAIESLASRRPSP